MVDQLKAASRKNLNIKVSDNGDLPFNLELCRRLVDKKTPFSRWVKSNRLETSSWFTLIFVPNARLSLMILLDVVKFIL